MLRLIETRVVFEYLSRCLTCIKSAGLIETRVVFELSIEYAYEGDERLIETRVVFEFSIRMLGIGASI